MLDQQDREQSEEYGPWAWIAGFAIGGVIILLMFTLATGRF
ncbi:MAG: dihydroxy-acid dehydratase [Pseudomonadota bacterium]